MRNYERVFLLIFIFLVFLGSISFGIWQNSVFAGIFSFIFLLFLGL